MVVSMFISTPEPSPSAVAERNLNMSEVPWGSMSINDAYIGPQCL